MNDDEYREVLRLLDRPAPVSAEFTERVFALMREELDTERSSVAVPTARARRHIFRLRPALAVAVAAVVTVLAASLVVQTHDAPSALAALQEARAQFRALPAHHARTAVAANENNDDPDFESRWETEDWYRDADTWSTTIRSSNAAFAGQPGDYQVLAGGLYGDYDAQANVFTATPAAERDGGRPMSPAFFFDPSLQWWSTGDPSDPGRPSDQFFEESCSATDASYIGRATTRLTCAAKPRDIELVLDKETGMLLRVSVFDVRREVTSIEFDPEFPAGTFDVVAPEGAKKRWGGEGTPPPEYQVALGTDVAARYQVTDGAVDGAFVATVSRTDVWIITTRCGSPGCEDQLRRVDAKTGQVLAVIDPPNRAFMSDVAEVGDDLWVSMAERSADGAVPTTTFVQRLDLQTHRLVGARIETGHDTTGRLVAAGGDLWSTGGASREVKVGPAETTYRSVARIDPSSGKVTQLELDGGAIGSPIVANGLVWLGTDKINEADPYETDYAVVAIDPATNAVVHRIAAPGPVDALTFAEGRLYCVLPRFEGGSESWLLAVAGTDAPAFTTGEVPLARTALGRSVYAAGSIWITSFLQDAVLKIDPVTLEVTGSVATGRGPAGIGVGLGAVWVTNSQDGTLVRIDV